MDNTVSDEREKRHGKKIHEGKDAMNKKYHAKSPSFTLPSQQKKMSMDIIRSIEKQ